MKRAPHGAPSARCKHPMNRSMFRTLPTRRSPRRCHISAGDRGAARPLPLCRMTSCSRCSSWVWPSMTGTRWSSPQRSAVAGWAVIGRRGRPGGGGRARGGGPAELAVRTSPGTSAASAFRSGVTRNGLIADRRAAADRPGDARRARRPTVAAQRAGWCAGGNPLAARDAAAAEAAAAGRGRPARPGGRGLGHRLDQRRLFVTPLVRHAAPPAPLVDSVKPE
jgi:hypothetical protein